MSNESEIFSPKVGGAYTERFFCKLISRSKSKRTNSFVKTSYIDKSIQNQAQFLKKQVSKSKDFKYYEPFRKSSEKTTRSRVCLKPELCIRPRSKKKSLETFNFITENIYRNSKKLYFNHSVLSKQRPTTRGNESDLNLIDFLRQSLTTASPPKPKPAPDLQLTKLKLIACTAHPN